MRAIVLTNYGSPDGLRLTNAEKPTPKDNEVRIRIRATTVTAGDVEIRTLKFPIWLMLPIRLYVGFIKPRNFVLGQELAGDVETVGKDVTRFKVGDAVFGATGLRFGGYAEYICLPEAGALAIKPQNLTYEQAAAVPVAGLEALHFMRQGNILSGQKVLINGAGGSIGTFAVQLAKSYGAEVTAVDRTRKLETLRSIGAAHVIDYTQEDFTQSGKLYDVIFDVMGKTSFSGVMKSLKSGGRYLLANAGLSQMIRGRWRSRTRNKKVIFGSGLQNTEDLVLLKALIEAGTIKPVIDRHYPLEQSADAHRYVETGEKTGNVVITVGHDIEN